MWRAIKNVPLWPSVRHTLLVVAFLVSVSSLADDGSVGATSDGFRGSYFVGGEIHVNVYGTAEGKPLTTGHWDFKPSWSKTGDMLVFFRRL
ncbi:hypothetical protein N9298_01490, partial [bacterium]|nr:hypothetical protein [bacterium]